MCSYRLSPLSSSAEGLLLTEASFQSYDHRPLVIKHGLQLSLLILLPTKKILTANHGVGSPGKQHPASSYAVSPLRKLLLYSQKLSLSMAESIKYV